MPRIFEPQAEAYINSLLPARDAVLRKMESYAAKHDVPIVGPACARVLLQLALLVRARRVFEMGSAIGYSTVWLARAVGPRGKVFYTDGDPANAERARAYLREAGVLGRVKIMVGDALESLKVTPGQFDLIFNDVSKTQYPEVFKLAVPRVRVGGLFITDNVLWHGKVAQPAAADDAETRAVQKFNRLVYKSPDLLTTIVPLRDGLAVCLKQK
ncbi:MAG: O-methyltransferase [Acidobacteria bacterium]|nr:MAG: O-methyltransferase [Acidobacteriota bacterium]